MSKKEFLNGDRIGKITVVDIGDYKNLLCKCDCGAIVKKTNEALRTAKSRGSDFYSCGCSMYQYKDGSKNYQWKGFGKISAKRWHAYKNSAKIRNIEFLISIKEAWNQLEKQNFKCALTGVTIGFGKNDKDVKNNTASLDRINSNVGYTLNNIQWVHKQINNIKWSLSEAELIYFAKLICKPLNLDFKSYECFEHKKHKNWSGYGNVSSSYWSRTLAQAKKRGIDFNIKIEDVWGVFLKQNGTCTLTGLPITLGREEMTASLDRINSNVGYTLNNIQWVHKVVNINLKKNLDEDELKKWCKLITQNKGNNYEAVKS